jgi:CCR4-NOT transcriptional regulation complex NOT5 subunit
VARYYSNKEPHSQKRLGFNPFRRQHPKSYLLFINRSKPWDNVKHYHSNASSKDFIELLQIRAARCAASLIASPSHLNRTPFEPKHEYCNFVIQSQETKFQVIRDNASYQDILTYWVWCNIKMKDGLLRNAIVLRLMQSISSIPLIVFANFSSALIPVKSNLSDSFRVIICSF